VSGRDSYEWFAATANGVLLSASQIQQLNGCLRRWLLHRIYGFREPQGAAAEQGTKHHEEMERWSKLGILPTSKPALAALKYAPAPGLAAVEVPCRFDTPSTPWGGFIDLAYDWDFTPCAFVVPWAPLCHGKPAELGTTGVTVIHDWKFTGNLRNAKTDEDLLKDPAANIYAYEAFLGGATRVLGRWVYVQMKGSPTTREVWFEFELEDVLRVLSKLDHDGEFAQVLYTIRPKADITPHNTTQCYKFGQECIHKTEGRCTPNDRFRFGQDPGDKYMEDLAKFRAEMMGMYPGATPPAVSTSVAATPSQPKTPPPLPAKKAPPLPPKKPSVTQILGQAGVEVVTLDPLAGLPTSTFVNPPEQPERAPASPEEAIVQQGIEPPKAPEADDLDALERDALKELGESLGAFPANTRMRAPGMRDAIRIRRKQLASGAPAAAEPDTFEAEKADTAARAAQARAEFEQTLAELAIEPTQREVAAVEHPAGEPATGVVFTADKEIHVTTKATAPTGTDVQGDLPRAKIEAPPWTLFVNCRPDNVSTCVTQAELVLRGNAMIKAESGAEDYRLIEFGKGAAYLGLAVKAALEEGDFGEFVGITIDTRTPEGSVLVTTLEALASLVVRAA
jgi:hypothetical protein